MILNLSHAMQYDYSQIAQYDVFFSSLSSVGNQLPVKELYDPIFSWKISDILYQFSQKHFKYLF